MEVLEKNLGYHNRTALRPEARLIPPAGQRRIPRGGSNDVGLTGLLTEQPPIEVLYVLYTRHASNEGVIHHVLSFMA